MNRDVTDPPAVRRRRALFPQSPPAPAAAALWLAGAFLLILMALTALVALAGGIVSGPAGEADIRVLQWMDDRATPTLTRWAVTVTGLGSWLVVAVMALLLSAFLWFQGERRAVALLAVGLLGIALLGDLLKSFFGRARPEVFPWRTPAGGMAFPSGHAMNAAAAYTLFSYLVGRLAPSRRLRLTILAAAGILVLLVGLSRMYLGVHYPSDVLAGLLVGFAWAVACVLVVRGGSGP